MNKFSAYDVLEFLNWLKPLLSIIERNRMFSGEREEAFKVINERMSLLRDQIHYAHDMRMPEYNPGEVEFLDKLHGLQDTRKEKENG